MVRQLILPLQSCHKFKKDDISAAKILHSVACGISFLLTIAEISSCSIQLSQEIMACLTRSFPNELNAGYFGAPFLQLLEGTAAFAVTSWQDWRGT